MLIKAEQSNINLNLDTYISNKKNLNKLLLLNLLANILTKLLVEKFHDLHMAPPCQKVWWNFPPRNIAFHP